MTIDREKAKQAFASYVQKYDPTDPKIALKIKHTYRVADLCQRIGESLSLPTEQLDVAWVCGLLHDIGRFEQIRRFGTFVDADSIDHALMSTLILFGEGDSKGCIRDFVSYPDADQVIFTAIRHHSAYRLPEGLDDWTLTCCQILRDADKIDIFRVNLDTPMEDIYNCTTEELMKCNITPEVMYSFDEQHAVLRSLKKVPIDHVVGHICLAYELVYPESRKITLEQGYLNQLMSFRNEDELAIQQMEYIEKKMTEYLMTN